MIYPEDRKLHFKDSGGIWHFHGDLYSKGDKRVCSLQTVAKYVKPLRALGKKEVKPRAMRKPIRMIDTKKEKCLNYLAQAQNAHKLLGHEAEVGTDIRPLKKKKKRRKIDAG